MMLVIITSMQFVAIISATAPHADTRHFRGPVAGESATQERLHEATDEAAKRVHEAASAARKAAHGDGSDNFANSLEQSMMQLEKEDHDLHEKAKERIAQHELEHNVEKQIEHAHQVAHQRALHMTSGQAFQQLHKAAEAARKRAHRDGSVKGDGSDSFANELEHSIMDLEEQKHENEFKAHERQVQHEHEREVKAEHRAEQIALANENKAMQAALGNEDKVKSPEEAVKQVHTAAANMREVAHGDGSDRWANAVEESMLDLEAEKHDFEEKARLRQAKHKLEHEVQEELFRAEHPQKPITVVKRSLKFLAPREPVVQKQMYNGKDHMPGLDDAYTTGEIVQNGRGLVVFLLIALLAFFGISFQKMMNSKDQSVVVPGLGKIDVVQSERVVRGLFNGSMTNAGLAIYENDTKAAAPLRSAFGSSKGATPYFTL